MSNLFNFPKSSRLLSPEDYKLVFRSSKKLHFREFTVYIRENNLTFARLGLAVSKKTAKKAVTRNLIKRIIRDSFRLNQNALSGWDIVFVSKQPASLLSKSELGLLLSKTWKRFE